MKERLYKYAKEAALFITVMFLFANLLSFYRSLDLNKKPIGLSTVTLLDAKRYDIEKEKPLLVHFWATWCPVCKAEAQNIQRISQRYNVLSVAVRSGSDEDIKEYMLKEEIDFKVINDIDGSISKKFNISVFPTTIIYDKNGNESFSEVGYTTTGGLFLRLWWAGLQ